jgi:hypothetical protein
MVVYPNRQILRYFLKNTAAKTAIIEKIPIVTPSKESNVLKILLRNALNAK